MAEENYTRYEETTNRKPLVIGIIVIVTVVLSLVSIFIAFQFRTNETPTPQEPDDQSTGQACTFGSECPACDYPQVAFCQHPQGGSCGFNQGNCTCTRLPQVDTACNGTVCSGVDKIPLCELQTCESAGLEECGNSIENNGSIPAGCGANPTIFSCETRCTDCNNATRISRYCKQPTVVTPPPNNRVCAQSCDANNVCSDGSTCIAGVCANPSCPTDSDCTCDVTPPPVCGGACSDANPCSDGTVCSTDGICVNPTCPEDGDCTCDVVTPDDAVCNEACDEDTPCSDGTVCSESGICVNPDCSEDTDCTCDTTETPPMCGETCTIGGEDCSDGMSCIDGVCANPSCTDSPNCTCEIPVTGILDDDSNVFLVVGLIFITIGLLTITQREIMNRGYAFVGENNILRNSVRETKKKRNFEQKVDEDMQ